MLMKKTLLSLALGCAVISTNTLAKDYFRFENSFDVNAYEVEARFNTVGMLDVLVSRQEVDSDVPLLDMDYSLNLAYARYTLPLSQRLIAQADLGIGYETLGDGYETIASATGVSQDIRDNSLAAFTTLGLNYVIAPQIIAGLDATASQDIVNESLTGNYRTRATLTLLPFKGVEVVYRAGLSYVQNDFTRAASAEYLVGGNFLVSHEFYAGYKSKVGLTPYLLLKDMNNSGDRLLSAGIRYEFK